MNFVKMQIAKEIFDVAKDAYSKNKHGSGAGNGGYNYGYGVPHNCHCRQGQGGRMSKDPMQFISSLKNSQQLKSLPQKLQGLASMKHAGGHGGGAKKVLPQVLKKIKSRMF